MAPNRGRNHFDPEADDIPHDSSDGDASSLEEEAADGARQHYVDVGKSKLRKPKTSALGPQYRGSRVDRDALVEEEDEDDPFGRDFENEDSEEEDRMASHNEGSSEGEDDMEDGTSGTDMSDDEMDPPRTPHLNGETAPEDKVGLQKAAIKDQKVVAASLSQATKAEAEKGRAVKKQKAAFDSLLNTRIKLQKTLVGVNTIVGLPEEDLRIQCSEAKEAIDAAEVAAFRLWSSLNDMREELTEARAGVKRKRTNFAVSTSTTELWAHMQTQEESALPHRNATLQRWSVKIKEGTAVPDKGVIDKSANQSTIIDGLQEHLSNRERLWKRAHTPRSCAPLQLSNNATSDTRIYDDADFYGLLLKELLEQKSADSVATSNIDLNFNLRREAKTKKNVDTKASKGRKLRYTVHEKLQNFMAPEDRSSWSERQADELFGSLFGRSMGLVEGNEDDVDMVHAVGEEESLMLFRS